MSAFIVEDKTINKIVTWLAEDRESTWYRSQVEKLGYDFTKKFSIEKLAKDMFALNCIAVDSRYGQGEAEKFKELNFRFQKTYAMAGEIEVLKAIKCWHYQCSEGDEVPNNLLYLLMEKIAGNIAEGIVSRMPQYDHCPWA